MHKSKAYKCNVIILISILFFILIVPASLEYRRQWFRFYKAVIEWNIEFMFWRTSTTHHTGEIWLDSKIIIYDAIIVDLRHIYSNVYIIGENGDTIFKHIKKEQ